MGSRQVLVVALALVATVANAWSDSAHGAITILAYRHLTPEVQKRFDELMKTNIEPKYQSTAMAGVWADDYYDDKVNTGRWHYINYHFRADGRKSTNQPDRENVVWAIDKFTRQLKDRSASPNDRAFAFRFVLHLVEDVHNPMHTVARDTDRAPGGDRGGNDFLVVPGQLLPRSNTNLHRVWDSGCGAFDLPMRGGEPGFAEACEGLADEIEKECSFEQYQKEPRTMDPNDWALEGFKIAQDFCYKLPEGGTPTHSYVEEGQRIARKRAAYAAYRLAKLLNDALKS
jgi:hypothetical protein